jgi:hypothetical protein
VGSSIAQWLSPQFGEAIRVTIDTDRIDALAADRAALWDRVSNAPFLTLNEKREAVGYAPVAGGDKWERVTEAKYSPAQLRVPAGNPRGGQWTDRGGGGGQGQSLGASLAQPMGDVGIGDVSGSSELGDLFRIRSDDTRADSANLSDSVGKVAADDTGRRYSVDLREEEARGGHTLRDHVGKTDEYLIGVMNADYKRWQSGNLEITEFRDAEGSFATPEQANDHVNQLLKLERDKVDQVATGMKGRALLERRIGSVTGYEAFRPDGDSDPYIRDTYGVRAVIIHDSRSPRGYTVRTAFPVNERPGRR